MGFGRRMRTMRAYRKVSQAELQQRTGIQQAIISRMEAEQVTPNADWEGRIREALGWNEEVQRAFAILEGEAEKEPSG